MRWRVIPLETYSAAMNMAIDAACLDHVAQGLSNPTMRFYRWSPDAISIGYFQCLDDEVDMEVVSNDKLEIVRRLTGGGAVYHSYEGEITYSLVAPENLYSLSINKSYQEICDFILKSLSSLGIKAIFKPINDILVDNKKISGNAQTRKKGTLLQHGTILYSVDAKKMFQYLKTNQKKLDAKAIKSVYKVVTSISEYVSLGIEEVYESLFDSFVDDKDWEFGILSDSELKMANNLKESIYLDSSYTGMR